MVRLTKIVVFLLLLSTFLEAQIIRNNGPGTRKFGSIIRESLYSGGGDGGDGITALHVDSLEADNLMSVGANVNLKLVNGDTQVAFWGDWWDDETANWYNATLGTAAPVATDNSLQYPAYNTTGGHTSVAGATALRSETNGFTIFTVWGADRIASGNYLLGWRASSSNYLNIVHLSSDTTIAWRANDGDGTEAILTLFDPAWVTVSGDTGQIAVHAFQYDPVSDSVYAYRSGEKVGVYLGAGWSPAATWLNSAGAYPQINAFNNAETDSDIRDLFILGRVYSTDTVNAVCKWFADRWNLTWELAQ